MNFVIVLGISLLLLVSRNERENLAVSRGRPYGPNFFEFSKSLAGSVSYTRRTVSSQFHCHRVFISVGCSSEACSVRQKLQLIFSFVRELT